MTCETCTHIIYRARIVNGKDYCTLCAPCLTPGVGLFIRAAYGTFKGTTAHLNDIRSRKFDQATNTTYREEPKRSYSWLNS